MLLTWNAPGNLKLRTSVNPAPGGWSDEPAAFVVIGVLHTITIPVDQIKWFCRLTEF